jgi:hypothetical protein
MKFELKPFKDKEFQTKRFSRIFTKLLKQTVGKFRREYTMRTANSILRLLKEDLEVGVRP